MLRAWFAVLTLLSWNVSRVRATDLESAWHAPHGCPSAAAADQRLRERNDGVSLLARGSAEVWIDRTANGELRARISLRGVEGREQRVLYGRDCEALSEAVLLVISMASEVDDPAPTTAHEPEPEPPREPRAPPEEPAPMIRDERPAAPQVTLPTPPAARGLNRSPRVRAWSIRLGPAFTVDRGSLPGTSFAVGGALALGVDRFQAAIAASYFSRHRMRLVPVEGASAEFGLVTAELRGCYIALGDSLSQARKPAAKKYALAPCIALEMGAQRGQGDGLSRAATQTGFWAAGMLGLSASLGPYGRMVPLGSLSLGFPMKRPRFEVEQAGLLFQAHPVIMRAMLGLMIELNP